MTKIKTTLSIGAFSVCISLVSCCVGGLLMATCSGLPQGEPYTGPSLPPRVEEPVVAVRTLSPAIPVVLPDPVPSGRTFLLASSVYTEMQVSDDSDAAAYRRVASRHRVSVRALEAAYQEVMLHTPSRTRMIQNYLHR